MSDISSLQLLLLQIRREDDPIRPQEVDCFVRATGVPAEQIRIVNLLFDQLTDAHLDEIDAAFIGGSGHYSVTAEETWLYEALDSVRLLFESRVPTFASCWGFQAVARALGGEVVHDLSRAELGTEAAFLTEHAFEDELFKDLPETFHTFMGHEDIVDQIPESAVLLASTDKVRNQAFTFPDRMFYATQFHPELTRDTLLDRARNYPTYVEKIAGVPWSHFESEVQDAPETQELIPRFMEMVMSNLNQNETEPARKS